MSNILDMEVPLDRLHALLYLAVDHAAGAGLAGEPDPEILSTTLGLAVEQLAVVQVLAAQLWRAQRVAR